MKRIFSFLLLVTVFNLFASGQNKRLNAYASYVFDDGFDSYYDNYDYYKGKIKGSFQLGAGFEYLLNKKFSLELLYLHQDTHAPTYYQQGLPEPVEYADFDLKLDYILLGAQSLFTYKDWLEGSGGLLGGLVIADMTDPRDGRSASRSKFSWGGRVAGNIWVAKRIGIKIQAQFLSIAQAAGGGFYFGIPGDGIAVGTYSTIYQFSLGGGLILKFGKTKATQLPATF